MLELFLAPPVSEMRNKGKAARPLLVRVDAFMAQNTRSSHAHEWTRDRNLLKSVQEIDDRIVLRLTSHKPGAKHTITNLQYAPL